MPTTPLRLPSAAKGWPTARRVAAMGAYAKATATACEARKGLKKDAGAIAEVPAALQGIDYHPLLFAFIALLCTIA